MTEFTSPSETHLQSAPKHPHTLTSFRRSAPKFMESRTSFIGSSSGFTWYSKSMSMCSDMLFAVRPTTRRQLKPADSTKRTATAALLPSHDELLATLLASSRGTSGTWMPKDDTVEPTKKTEKQVKPMSKSMKLLTLGGLSRPRIKYISKMYANMSGEAHFEMACTTKMHRRAQRTLVAPPRCRYWPKPSSTSLSTGMTIAYNATKMAPVTMPSLISRATKEAVVSSYSLTVCWPNRSVFDVNRGDTSPGISSA